ncbi:MAG TPA: porin, partial [Rhodopila sp.]
TAYNFTAAIDYIGGAVNGQLAERPTGGASTNAITTGLTYANGPITLGATVGLIDTQGDARLTNISQRHEYEVAFGGTYRLAPGVQLVGEYQYAHRHQGGFDFSQGAPGLNGTTRDAQFQGLTFMTVMTW